MCFARFLCRPGRRSSNHGCSDLAPERIEHLAFEVGSEGERPVVAEHRPDRLIIAEKAVSGSNFLGQPEHDLGVFAAQGET